ncbi:hypothetical protein L596_008787 [Steinernema carpocapsae]|uniref:Uncharacterized protein n=1 Tax=Steinernema carpocapsae TaxID=34508 RepID=A0A4U5PDK7_STECR|nr:hypothetical protein L596_008787 [Steinernema carpocapsae]
MTPTDPNEYFTSLYNNISIPCSIQTPAISLILLVALFALANAKVVSKKPEELFNPIDGIGGQAYERTGQ